MFIFLNTQKFPYMCFFNDTNCYMLLKTLCVVTERQNALQESERIEIWSRE